MIKKRKKSYLKKRKKQFKLRSFVYASDKSKTKIPKAVFNLIFFGVLVWLVCFAIMRFYNYTSTSEKFIIKDIEIVGGKNVTKTEIRELLPFKAGDNIIKVNLSQARDEIKALKPELKNIKISRQWQKVYIKLYEREPEAFVQENGVTAGIDFENTPFPLRGYMSESLVPELAYKTLDGRAFLIKFVKALKTAGAKDFLTRAQTISLGSSEGVTITMRDGTMVFWGDVDFSLVARKFKKAKEVYKKAISSYGAIDYIDMSFYDDGRALVKPKT
jgi:cell division protein FtsQ